MSSAPTVDGIHHLKFAVTDVDQSLKFYEDVFGAVRLPHADHIDADGNIYAYICDMPGWGTLLDIRLSPRNAVGDERFDPITLNVEDQAALAAWAAHCDALGVANSGPFPTGLAYMMVIEDPDKRRIRLYTREKKAPDVVGVDTKSHPWMVYD